VLTLKTVTLVVALAAAALCGGVVTHVAFNIVGEKPAEPKCESPKKPAIFLPPGENKGTGADKEY